MKRFTVIVAMLATLLMSANAFAATAAGWGTDPATGASASPVGTSWNVYALGMGLNASSVQNTILQHTMRSQGITYIKASITPSSWKNLVLFNSSVAQYNATSNFIGNTVFTLALNASASVGNNTMLSAKDEIGRGMAPTNAPYNTMIRSGFMMSPDKNLIVGSLPYTVNDTLAANRNGTTALIISQSVSADVNRLAGNWKVFGMYLGNATTGGNRTMSPTYAMADLFLNSSDMSSTTINGTIYYRTGDRSAALGAVTKNVKVRASLASGRVTVSESTSGRVWLDSAVMDPSLLSMYSLGNKTFSQALNSKSNSTSIAIAVKPTDANEAVTFQDKNYGLVGWGTDNVATSLVGSEYAPLSLLGTLPSVVVSSSRATFGANGNLSMFGYSANGTVSLYNTISDATGNGTIVFGSDDPTQYLNSAMKLYSQRLGANLGNITFAKRADGGMYVGLWAGNNATGMARNPSALVVIFPSTLDDNVVRNSLSSDFVTDTQFLAATGLNQCPRANASQTGSCFELSHTFFPTTGPNARPANNIEVSTYVQSVIAAADNASIMNTALLNATAKADSADYPGNFTSEEYTGAPVELKSMYSFNGTSFQLVNASNDVRLLAKWVFVANGTGTIGGVAGLTAEQADPWKFMKKYQDIKNATAYAKVYGNGTLQNWSTFWDADGNTAALADGTVFYTQFGTNASLLAPLQKTDTFTSGTTYVLWAVLANGGKFDLDNSTDFVFDPPRIVTDEEIVISSSSSSGCVFNPVAGFGLEWLLLLLAPAVGIIRSRFRK